MNVKKLTTASLLIALGVITAHTVSIPIGVSKAFPIQHAINVISAALLGTPMAMAVAFIISLIRNIMGTGSLLAFPGSLFGAFFAGLIFSKTKRVYMAVIGEVFGTSVLGGLSAFPLAKLLMGSQVAAFFFVVPFALSSISGAIIGFVVLKALYKSNISSLELERGKIQ